MRSKLGLKTDLFPAPPTTHFCRVSVGVSATVQQVQLSLRSATARMNTSSSAQAGRTETQSSRRDFHRLTYPHRTSETDQCNSPSGSLALCSGLCGDERWCSSSSSVTKFGVTLCLSSAWRPTGFKPLRAVISTDEEREGAEGVVVVVVVRGSEWRLGQWRKVI